MVGTCDWYGMAGKGEKRGVGDYHCFEGNRDREKMLFWL